MYFFSLKSHIPLLSGTSSTGILCAVHIAYYNNSAIGFFLKWGNNTINQLKIKGRNRLS